MTLFEEGTTWRRKLARFLPDKISARCFFCLLFFGVFFSVAGIIMTGATYSNSEPHLFTPRSTDKEKEIEVIKIVGPLLLSLGLTASVVSVVLRFRQPLWQLGKKIAGRCAKKSEDAVEPESAYSNQFQLQVRETDQSDSLSASVHSVDSKILANNMMY